MWASNLNIVLDYYFETVLETYLFLHNFLRAAKVVYLHCPSTIRPWLWSVADKSKLCNRSRNRNELKVIEPLATDQKYISISWKLTIYQIQFGGRTRWKVVSAPETLQPGAVLRWGRVGGALDPLQIHLLSSPRTPLPDSKASWPFWRDFWGHKTLQNPNFPGPLGELTALPRPPNWWGGARCPLPRIPPRSRPFGPRFYGSQRLTH